MDHFSVISRLLAPPRVSSGQEQPAMDRTHQEDAEKRVCQPCHMTLRLARSSPSPAQPASGETKAQSLSSQLHEQAPPPSNTSGLSILSCASAVSIPSQPKPAPAAVPPRSRPASSSPQPSPLPLSFSAPPQDGMDPDYSRTITAAIRGWLRSPAVIVTASPTTTCPPAPNEAYAPTNILYANFAQFCHKRGVSLFPTVFPVFASRVIQQCPTIRLKARGSLRYPRNGDAMPTGGPFLIGLDVAANGVQAGAAPLPDAALSAAFSSLFSSLAFSCQMQALTQALAQKSQNTAQKPTRPPQRPASASASLSRSLSSQKDIPSSALSLAALPTSSSAALSSSLSRPCPAAFRPLPFSSSSSSIQLPTESSASSSSSASSNPPSSSPSSVNAPSSIITPTPRQQKAVYATKPDLLVVSAMRDWLRSPAVIVTASRTTTYAPASHEVYAPSTVLYTDFAAYCARRRVNPPPLTSVRSLAFADYLLTERPRLFVMQCKLPYPRASANNSAGADIAGLFCVGIDLAAPRTPSVAQSLDYPQPMSDERGGKRSSSARGWVEENAVKKRRIEGGGDGVGDLTCTESITETEDVGERERERERQTEKESGDSKFGDVRTQHEGDLPETHDTNRKDEEKARAKAKRKKQIRQQQQEETETGTDPIVAQLLADWLLDPATCGPASFARFLDPSFVTEKLEGFREYCEQRDVSTTKLSAREFCNMLRELAANAWIAQLDMSTT